MPEPIMETPVATIQVEAINALARGFDKRDYANGAEHRGMLETLTRSIATADNSDVKTEGIRKLGDYSVRTSVDTHSEYLQVKSVQDEAVDAIATISAEDPDIKVKDAGLEQVARRLDLRDYRNGEVHSGAIDAIRRIATSATVKEGDQTAAPMVKKAIDILSGYSTRTSVDTHSEYLQVKSVQEQAKGIIHLITSTVGVEKFSDLKP